METMTNFILNLLRDSPNMPADEIISKGKEAGYTIHRNYIHSVKFRKKREIGKQTSLNILDDAGFQRAAVRIGLDKAKELIAEIERKIP